MASKSEKTKNKKPSGDKKQSKMRTGPAVEVIPDLEDKSIVSQAVTDRIHELNDEACREGYAMTVKSVTYGGGAYIVLYNLEFDESFSRVRI